MADQDTTTPKKTRKLTHHLSIDFVTGGSAFIQMKTKAQLNDAAEKLRSSMRNALSSVVSFEHKDGEAHIDISKVIAVSARSTWQTYWEGETF
jgi:hypothetical protein